MRLRKHTLRFIPPILFVMLYVHTVIPTVYADTATVKSTTVNVRSGPGLEYEVIDQIKKGNTYTIFSSKNSWVEIDLGNSKKGWVADWLVDIALDTPQSSIHTYIESTVPILNVRSGPSTSFTIVEKISPGKTYALLEKEGEWGKIQLSTSNTGWVSLQYTKTVEEKSNSNTESSNPTKESSGPATDSTDKTQEETTLVVDTEILNLRKSPSLEAEILKKLTKGTVAKALSSNGDWSEVQLNDGTKGWVFRSYMKEVKGVVDEPSQKTPTESSNTPVPTGAKVKILTEGTNLRKGPSTKEAVIQKAKQGQEYAILQTVGDWFQIDLGNGKTAYVAGWVVAAEGVPNVVRGALQGKVIVVDAGHGGQDHGAQGAGKKTKEKEINLTVANILAKKLEAAGATVIMTRTDDTFISLQGRVDISIKHNADAFISIHHNSYNHSSMNGSMTFYYTSADKTLAKYIQADLVKANGLKDLGARKGDYYVLRENPQLSVLVELGFLSNLNEELVIRSSKFQENSAEGIFQGIVKYFAQNK